MPLKLHRLGLKHANTDCNPSAAAQFVPAIGSIRSARDRAAHCTPHACNQALDRCTACMSFQSWDLCTSKFIVCRLDLRGAACISFESARPSRFPEAMMPRGVSKKNKNWAECSWTLQPDLKSETGGQSTTCHRQVMSLGSSKGNDDEALSLPLSQGLI